jgi:hypothetical protein
MKKSVLGLMTLAMTFSAIAGTISKKNSDRKVVIQENGKSLVTTLNTSYGPIFERSISLSQVDSHIEYKSKLIKKGLKFNSTYAEEIYNYETALRPMITPYGMVNESLEDGDFGAEVVLMLPMTGILDTMLLPISLPSRLIRNGSVNKDLRILKKVISEDVDVEVNKRRFARILVYLDLLYDKYRTDLRGLKVHWENYNQERGKRN